MVVMVVLAGLLVRAETGAQHRLMVYVVAVLHPAVLGAILGVVREVQALKHQDPLQQEDHTARAVLAAPGVAPAGEMEAVAVPETQTIAVATVSVQLSTLQTGEMRAHPVPAAEAEVEGAFFQMEIPGLLPAEGEVVVVVPVVIPETQVRLGTPERLGTPVMRAHPEVPLVWL